MANGPIYNHLRELSWRRTLSAAEEAELWICLAARHLLSFSLLAQAATNPPALTLSNSTVPRLLVTRPPTLPTPGPPFVGECGVLSSGAGKGLRQLEISTSD